MLGSMICRYHLPASGFIHQQREGRPMGSGVVPASSPGALARDAPPWDSKLLAFGPKSPAALQPTLLPVTHPRPQELRGSGPEDSQHRLSEGTCPPQERALLKSSHVLLTTAPYREAWPSLRGKTGTATQLRGPAPAPAPAFPREDSQLFLAQGVQRSPGTWQLLPDVGAVTA